MKTKVKYTKEQARGKKMVRLFFVQNVLLLLFLFFCIIVLLESFSWRIFFALCFLLSVCGLYAWAVMQRRMGKIDLFENIISVGFFIWFCGFALILSL
ncbi:MAG: hypothetical protein LBG48_05945 [Rickettsiales bacterium]|jgi:hypothetical protein|nr:hypothetical protein [Rickettsiales bacterium]